MFTQVIEKYQKIFSVSWHFFPSPGSPSTGHGCAGNHTSVFLCVSLTQLCLASSSFSIFIVLVFILSPDSSAEYICCQTLAEKERKRKIQADIENCTLGIGSGLVSDRSGDVSERGYLSLSLGCSVREVLAGLGGHLGATFFQTKQKSYWTRLSECLSTLLCWETGLIIPNFIKKRWVMPWLGGSVGGVLSFAPKGYGFHFLQAMATNQSFSVMSMFPPPSLFLLKINEHVLEWEF